MDLSNLHIIGTSHIAKQSINEVNKYIHDHSPDMVAIELDKSRLYSLLYQQKGSMGLSAISRIGLKGYIFAVLGGYISRKAGRSVGVLPGEEMKQAYKLARKKQLDIHLIDQSIERTLSRFSKKITWRERWNFLVDMFRGLFFYKREARRFGFNTWDIRKVPGDELIRRILMRIRVRYPNVYDVLIDERNQVMARRLREYMQLNPGKKVLAVVGAGHKDGIMKILANSKQHNFSDNVSYSFQVGA